MSQTTKPKSRLGRGLSSLISISELPVEVEVAEQGASEIQAASPSQPSNAGSPNQIPLDQIKPNPHQPRRVMNESSIAELAASLKTTGLIQPVIVRQTPDGFQLIAGERRWRAAKVAGLSTIPAIIRDVNSFEQAQMALIENIQREDLNPIDRAESYRSLINQLGLTQAELAGRLGEDRSSIANHLRLLELAEPVRNLIRDQKISLGHAKLLAGITNPAEQERLSNLVVDQQLSVRALEQMLQATTTDQPPAKDQPKLSAHIQDLERSISRQLGMKVQLRSARKGAGKLVISYASLDQFDELMMRLNVETE